MTTNLVIATYAGKYSIMNKDNYLKYTLILLNKIKTNITQITIMKSRVNDDHDVISHYYNFNHIDISNIKDKIKIIECENVGISYGALFSSFKYTSEFDYHIFMEDDYVCFMDNFEKYMIDNLKIDTFLCMVSFKDKRNIMESINEESDMIKDEFIDILNKYDITKNFKDHYFYIPDFSIGSISKTTVEKIVSIISIDIIMDLFKPKFFQLWIHQIIFGYILFLASINIDDVSDKNINLFYHTGKEVTMYNYPKDPFNWVDHFKKPLDIPIFCPIEFFYPYNQNINMFNLKKFCKNYHVFKERYYELNNIKRSIKYSNY